MTPDRDAHAIDTLPRLEALLGTLSDASVHKELPYVHPAYRAMIAASPFAVLATTGPGGLDASPRGDPAGFVQLLDDKTLLLPERRGNNRADSLRNILADPRVALLFLIPGSGTTFRVNGRAVITDDAALCQSFAVEGKPPRTVLVVTVERTYFQCARAIVRSGLWDASRHVVPGDVPTPGQVLERASQASIDGAAYDAEWPGRAAASLW